MKSRAARTSTLIALATIVLSSAGCNMVAGAGRDITNMSSSVQGWVDPAEEKRIDTRDGTETNPPSATTTSSTSTARTARYDPNL